MKQSSHLRLISAILACGALLAACGGGDNTTDTVPDVTTTTLIESTTTTPTTTEAPTTTTTTSTTTTMAPRPTLVINDDLAGFPIYEGDGFTYYIFEDPDPEAIGCEGFTRSRLWLQRGDQNAELVTELEEAGLMYAGPSGRMLIVGGCEGFLGNIYHADILPDGQLTNLAAIYIPIDAAYDFRWVDQSTVVATVGTYEGVWGDAQDQTRELAINLLADGYLVITSPGQAPLIGEVASCAIVDGGVEVRATDPDQGLVGISGDVLTWADGTGDATFTTVYPPEDGSTIWYMYGTRNTADDTTGPELNVFLSAPGCS